MIKTVDSHPGHQVVGHYYRSDHKNWLCDSYDSCIGFWMTEIRPDGTLNESNRRNVSERAIDRTWMEIHRWKDVGGKDTWEVVLWNIHLPDFVPPTRAEIQRLYAVTNTKPTTD